MVTCCLPQTISWADHDAGCTIVLAQPANEPRLWRQYCSGALRNYRRFGVEAALDYDAMCGGRDTALFYAAVDRTGRLVGGMRAKFPLRSAAEAHAMVEWRGQPGEDAVRKMISDRLPFGVVECGTAWVADTFLRRDVVAKAWARMIFPSLSLLHVDFVLATAAAHALDRWRSSGAVVAKEIPAVPYPNDRYRTKMIWWERRTLSQHADADQLKKMLLEMRTVRRTLSYSSPSPLTGSR